jgi:hypothetical protein
MKTKKGASEGINIKDLKNVSDLKLPRKQQLVRTTLQLSKPGHEAIKKVSKLQGMRNAEVFESMTIVSQKLDQEMIKTLFASDDKSEKSRKTYVIKKDTLSQIMSFSNEIKVSRDLFINKMAQLLSYIYDDERRNREKKYRDILENIIEPFEEKAYEVEAQLIKELGKDDPVISGFGLSLIHMDMLKLAIYDHIANGTPINL